MEETVIVIMLKEKQTGFLEKELISCKIDNNDDLLLNAFAEEDNGITVNIKLTTHRDVLDWEFNAVFDFYDTAVYNETEATCRESDDCFNPTWELVFPYNSKTCEKTINTLLETHSRELNEVFEIIKDREREYTTIDY